MGIDTKGFSKGQESTFQQRLLTTAKWKIAFCSAELYKCEFDCNHAVVNYPFKVLLFPREKNLYTS